MNDEQKAAVEAAIRFLSRSMPDVMVFSQEHPAYPMAAARHINALLQVIEAQEAEIEQLKANANTLRLVAKKDPLADFFAKEHEEANKPPHPPFVGKGGNIISRK